VLTRATVVPLLIVAAMYGRVGPSPAVAGALALLTLLSLLISTRAEAGTAAQIVISTTLFGLSAAVLATALPRETGAIEQLRTPWAAFAGATMMVAVSRLYLVKPLGGDNATVAVALVALAACGGTHSGSLYPTVVAVFCTAAFVARHFADRGRAPLRELGWRYFAPLALASGVVIVITGAWVSALPPLRDWVVRQAMRRARSRTGFGEKLQLGSLRGLLQSDRVVLRIRGRDTDYLRGIVYSRYYLGGWSDSRDRKKLSVELPRTIGPSDDVTELEVVESEPKFYFLPLDAAQLAVSSGIAFVDRAAILGPIAAEPADRIWFRPAAERMHPVAPASAEMLQLPREVRRRLTRLAQTWTQAEPTVTGKLAALEQKLSTDYEYSLDYERPAGHEPIVHFLLTSKHGHCEYFATAMTLLSRAIGIHARVVAGYRVTERNPLGDYHVVRERNAHAWVEAWVPEQGWRTYDPTPAAGLEQTMPSQTSLVGSLIDLGGTGWAAFLTWLDHRTIPEMVSTPIIALGLALLVRWLRRRRRRGLEADDEALVGALACFEELVEALAKRGIVRRASETVEQLARRVATAELSTADEVSSMLSRYAAWRYGGLGDRPRLEDDMSALAVRLQS
jgi:hypothetical protein